jgi:hypothetical protein
MKEHPVITETQPAPVCARDGEPCPACGAPLAGDQRYCLHCGARRPEARLEFLDVLDEDVRVRSGGAAVGGAAAAGGVVAPGGASLPPQSRLQANAGLLALGALLALALLIGLLVGHWATGEGKAPAAAAPAPQVITVAGAASTAAPAPTSTAAPSDTAAPSTKDDKTPKSTTKTETTAKAPKNSVNVGSLSSKKAVDDAVKKGKPISTGTGKLPPKDDKPAGGGSGFEEIQ